MLSIHTLYYSYTSNHLALCWNRHLNLKCICSGKYFVLWIEICWVRRHGSAGRQSVFHYGKHPEQTFINLWPDSWSFINTDWTRWWPLTFTLSLNRSLLCQVVKREAQRWGSWDWSLLFLIAHLSFTKKIVLIIFKTKENSSKMHKLRSTTLLPHFVSSYHNCLMVL